MRIETFCYEKKHKKVREREKNKKKNIKKKIGFRKRRKK